MIIKWYEITCDTCGEAQHFRGNVSNSQSQFKDLGGIVTANKKYYCCKKCHQKAVDSERKIEICEACGRDLPNSERCEFCGHNNHKLKLSGRATQRIRREIAEEKVHEVKD